ncbi:AraC family transcriptional regulator [Planococcus sp. ISL-110]|nr:AraC family transcriptional regulator [Planococcus sp. ISL-110]
MTDLFRFHTIQHFLYPRGQSRHQPLHRHPDSVELLLVLEGSVHCHIDNQAYSVPPGTVLLVQPGLWHELKFTTAQQQSGYRLSFTRKRSTTQALEVALPPVISISDLKRLEALFVGLQQESAQPQADSKQLAHYLIGLILTLLSRFASSWCTPSSKNAEATVQEIKRFMEENHCRSLTLEGLADRFCLNKYQLARLFKQHTGMSPLQYIISRRMDTAKQLLATTDSSAATIAGSVGYKSETQFQAAFKKAVGITPRHYRLEFKQKP